MFWAVLLVLAVFVILDVSRLIAARNRLALAKVNILAARAHAASRQDTDALGDLNQAEVEVQAARRLATSFPLALIRPLPLVGSPVRAVVDLARAGQEGVTAGRIVVNAIGALPTSGRTAINGQDLSSFHQAALTSIDALRQADDHLGLADRALGPAAHAAIPVLSGPVRSMRRSVADIRLQLSNAERGLDLLAQLTDPASDTRLLLLSQDSLELRPTGGFIGSFGVLHVNHGTLTMERYQDSLDLPPPVPPMTPPPDLARSLPRWWGLSNADWWPDFPTTATTAVEMFARSGGGHVDGVIAITDNVLARLVGVLGPVQLPGYDKPVTEEGFSQRVVDEVELKNPPDVPQKKFLIELANDMFTRMFHARSDQVPALAKSLGAAAQTGDIQLWFHDPRLEGDVERTSLAGSLPAPAKDFLMLVDANMAASKANAGLVRNVVYTVHRDGQGQYVAHLQAVFRDNDPAGPENPFYHGYLRVYAPLGSTLLHPPDGQTDEGHAPDGPFQVFGQDLSVDPLSQTTLTFDYRLPPSVAPGGQYQLTWLRQVGTPRDSLTATIRTSAVQADPSKRTLTVHGDFRGNPIMDFLRRRWLFKKLGL